MSPLSPLITAAEIMYHSGLYSDAARVLEIARSFCDISQYTNLRDNLRQCYFRSGQMEPAVALIIEQQNQQGLESQMVREHANCLRYLGRYTESLAISHSVPDDKSRCLDVSWHLHLQQQHQAAFAMTEQGRGEFGWSNIAIPQGTRRWRGEKLHDLVLLEEAGEGDMVLFARWIPLAQQRAVNVWYGGTSSMRSVFERNFAVRRLDQWDALNEDRAVLPMMSLAHELAVGDFSQNDPYLTASQDWQYYYNALLPKSGVRIGICWSGASEHLENSLRSVTPELMISHLGSYGEILSLQFDQPVPQGAVGIDITEWEHTLALIESCDVVVSVDTAVAHVAAAMGKPTVVVTNRACYYTWNPHPGCHRTTWYPAAWNFTQQNAAQWDQTLHDAAKHVATLLHSKV